MSIVDLQPHIRVLVNALSFVRFEGLSTIFFQRLTAKEDSWATHRLSLISFVFFLPNS